MPSPPTPAHIGSRPAPAEPGARSAKLRGMTPPDRGAAVALLARLLMEAAGVVARERDDDQR
jgi:hypothetical protein